MLITTDTIFLKDSIYTACSIDRNLLQFIIPKQIDYDFKFLEFLKCYNLLN